MHPYPTFPVDFGQKINQVNFSCGGNLNSHWLHDIYIYVYIYIYIYMYVCIYI